MTSFLNLHLGRQLTLRSIIEVRLLPSLLSGERCNTLPEAISGISNVTHICAEEEGREREGMKYAPATAQQGLGGHQRHYDRISGGGVCFVEQHFGFILVPGVPVRCDVRRVRFYIWVEGHDEVQERFGEGMVEGGVVERWLVT